MRLLPDLIARVRRQPRWRLLAALGVIAAALWYLTAARKTSSTGLTFATRRGPLDISVLEAGSVQALESQEVKCEARVGYQGVKILKIVEEGYQVSEEDIRTNKVLVELDSSDLQKQLVQQEIQFQSATASLTDAQQGYEIQLNQNLSDIKAAEQKSKFARMDFEKYLGDKAANEIVDKLREHGDLNVDPTNVVAQASALAAAELQAATNAPASGETAPPPAAAPAAEPARPPIEIDFSRYADIDVLGNGEAKQKLRELEDGLLVAKKELGQAQSTVAGTRRLADKGFVTKIDLERDEIAAENAGLKVQKAETARALFLKYEFVKTAEEWLSKYVEAVRELNRARKAAVSKLAQAEAKWRSAEAQFSVQQRQLKELKEQLEKCVITATKPGLVVYGGGEEMFYYGGEERIREGGTVRERQSIITIPDMNKMVVKVKIHESYIKLVKKGQKVRITVDAFPDKALGGEVTKVGVIPDSQNRWMNPDLKVYLTTINVDGTHDWLKPGMTAKVEIIVDRIADVLQVPIQAVVPKDGRQYCSVAAGHRSELREVEIGQLNDAFVEIKKGLKEGELVYLRPAATPSPAGSETKAPPTATTPASSAAAAPAKS